MLKHSWCNINQKRQSIVYEMCMLKSINTMTKHKDKEIHQDVNSEKNNI